MLFLLLAFSVLFFSLSYICFFLRSSSTLFCSTFSRNILCCSTEVKTRAFATGLMLWDFFLGVARKIKQSTNEGGTIPFLINRFKCHKSEDIEAATAGVDIDPVGKLG